MSDRFLVLQVFVPSEINKCMKAADGSDCMDMKNIPQQVQYAKNCWRQ